MPNPGIVGPQKRGLCYLSQLVQAGRWKLVYQAKRYYSKVYIDEQGINKEGLGEVERKNAQVFSL